jgi:capsular polysaccharide export protein
MSRSFLVLRTMPTPFFSDLGAALVAAGHAVAKVAFCGGDMAFWRASPTLAYRGGAAHWPEAFGRLVTERAVTDLVLVGPHRPPHQAALPAAAAAGLRVHLFGEAWLGLGWIGLRRADRAGAAQLPRDATGILARGAGLPPVAGGNLPASRLRRALREAASLFWSGWLARRFPESHADRLGGGWHEDGRTPLRALAAPFRDAAATLRAGPPAWLLLAGDDSSPFGPGQDAVSEVVNSFARHAPPGARLLLPAPRHAAGALARRIAAASDRHGVATRVILLPGDAAPLDAARGIVALSAEDALCAAASGKPVILPGTAGPVLPGLAFPGGLDAFWRDAEPPDPALTDALRRVLAAELLLRGGYDHPAAIAEALRGAVPRLLAP